MKRGAARDFAVMFGEEKAAAGRGVVSGQARQFFIEILEAEAETKGIGVFEEEFAGLLDLLGGLDLGDCEYLWSLHSLGASSSVRQRAKPKLGSSGRACDGRLGGVENLSLPPGVENAVNDGDVR